MEDEREAFEAAVFAYYSGLKEKGWSHPDEGDMSHESLFWLQPNGQYGVINLNAAWWAWQARAGWTESAVRMPPLETPVLCVHQGEHCILELRTDEPGFEDSLQDGEQLKAGDRAEIDRLIASVKEKGGDHERAFDKSMLERAGYEV
jgi:hypothetical protein